MNDLSKNTLVHLVFEQPDGTRHWFHTTERKKNDKTGEWLVLPIVGTEIQESHPMSFEIALVAQRRWKELGYRCRLTLEASLTAPFIDEEIAAPSEHPWKHQNYLVTVDADGKPLDDFDAPCVYSVQAVHTAQLGPAFVWKSDDGRLVNQPQFASFDEGPEACVQKAFERGFTKIEKPKPNPILADREAERKRIAEETARPQFQGRRRPGDI